MNPNTVSQGVSQTDSVRKSPHFLPDNRVLDENRVLTGELSLTFGSLFAGIGGLDLGLERAGLVCKFQVEIDDYCRQVLARHWPHVPRFADVCEVGAHNLPCVDVLVGGFPCQDLSNAGKRAGLDGARSGLWKEFARLIEELKPTYVIIENVAALLQRNNRFDCLLRDLATCGYDAQWQVLSAAERGAPHLRERVFIVACRQDSSGSEIAGRKNVSLADAGRVGCGDGVLSQLFQTLDRTELCAWPPAQSLECVVIAGRAYPGLPAHLRVDDGTARGLDNADRKKLSANEKQLAAARVKGCGNAVVPQVAEIVATNLLNWHFGLASTHPSTQNSSQRFLH